MSIDPALAVVAQAKVVRERWPELTSDAARFVAHCMVRHGYEPSAVGPLIQDEVNQFHVDEHDHPLTPEDHTHLQTTWPGSS